MYYYYFASYFSCFFFVVVLFLSLLDLFKLRHIGYFARLRCPAIQHTVSDCSAVRDLRVSWSRDFWLVLGISIEWGWLFRCVCPYIQRKLFSGVSGLEQSSFHWSYSFWWCLGWLQRDWPPYHKSDAEKPSFFCWQAVLYPECFLLTEHLQIQKSQPALLWRQGTQQAALQWSDGPRSLFPGHYHVQSV